MEIHIGKIREENWFELEKGVNSEIDVEKLLVFDEKSHQKLLIDKQFWEKGSSSSPYSQENQTKLVFVFVFHKKGRKKETWLGLV